MTQVGGGSLLFKYVFYELVYVYLHQNNKIIIIKRVFATMF